MSQPDTSSHIPVLLDPILKAIEPVNGVWIDGTFGAGGYTRALLEAGAKKVIAIDRDPEVFERAKGWADKYGSRLVLCQGRFSELDRIAAAQGEPVITGVVLDIGVSSMQIDQAARGFSFMQDGPLDMRMEQSGRSAADIVNEASETDLAAILFHFGEERASRRIARTIVNKRKDGPILTTATLSALIESCLPRPKKGQPHAATRSFQALRIAVNDELGQLAEGLMAAERVLAPGGLLVVVTFHSLEDRMVKRFIQLRSGAGPGGSRYQPEKAQEVARFEKLTRKAVEADEEELERNPRARSAKLRIARRLDAPAGHIDPAAIGMPQLPGGS